MSNDRLKCPFNLNQPGSATKDHQSSTLYSLVEITDLVLSKDKIMNQQ